MLLLLYLATVSVLVLAEPNCDNNGACTQGTAELEANVAWTSKTGTDELTITGDLRCMEPDCVLKIEGYKSVIVKGGVAVGEFRVSAEESITIEKPIDVSNQSLESSGLGGGAAHGGDGATAINQDVANLAFGEAIDVTTKGKRGGGTEGDGGNGGGLVRLESAKITLNGKITADGDSSAAETRGGGSGGGIYVSASDELILGEGVEFSAQGGESAGGPGAGGRIAIIFGNNSTATLTAVVSGGVPAGEQLQGGAGTFYVRGGGRDELLVDGGDSDPANVAGTLVELGDEKVGSVTIKNAMVRGDQLQYGKILWGLNDTLSLQSGFIRAMDINITGGGDLTLDATSRIDVSATNDDLSAPGAGQNATAAMLDDEGAVEAPATVGSGASHAGIGGRGVEDADLIDGHGSAYKPKSLGAPGGPGLPDEDGKVFVANGGGSIFLEFGGDAQIDGTVLADGANAQGNAGGGAAGSIWISADESLDGSGFVAARGGNATEGGGGGGGRVHVAWDQGLVKALAKTSNTGSGGEPDLTAPPIPPPLRTLLPPTLGWSVIGGDGANIPSEDDAEQVSGSMRRGGVGTMAANIGLEGNRLLVENDGSDALYPTFVGSGAGFTYSEINNVELRGAQLSGGAVTLDQGTTVRADAALSLGISHLRVFDGAIYAPAITLSGGLSLEVSEKGIINADGETRLKDPAKNVAGTDGERGSKSGGGGARGGSGAPGNLEDTDDAEPPAGGKATSAGNLGDLLEPSIPGGNGGDIGVTNNTMFERSAFGGFGGGVIKLDLKGAANILGVVSANGAIPREQMLAAAGDAGSGAGGSIYIRTSELRGTGTISAKGGDAQNQGGPGGGGRIAIAYANEKPENATIVVAGGVSSHNAGAPGTLVLVRELSDGKVVVKREPHLIVQGTSDFDPENSESTTLAAVPSTVDAIVDTLDEGRWFAVTVRNALISLTGTLDTLNFEMFNARMKQASVVIQVEDSLLIDKDSLIDTTATAEGKPMVTIPAGAGAGGCGNGGAPAGGTAYTPALSRAAINIANGIFGGVGASNTTMLTGGKGGGLIRLSASGKTGVIAIEGVLRANGGPGKTSALGQASGGGSGGGIELSAFNVTGSGQLQANGGTGAIGAKETEESPIGQHGGAGGGGCVKIGGFKFVSDSLDISVDAGVAIQDTMAAGVGTVFHQSSDLTRNEILIEGPENGFTSPSAKAAGTLWPLATADEISVILRNTFLSPSATNRLTLRSNGNLTVDNGKLKALNVLVAVNSVNLVGDSEITASGQSSRAADAGADSALTTPAQAYGAGGGSHAGFGIAPASPDSVSGKTGGNYPDGTDLNAIIRGNFKQPTSQGNSGGTVTPPPLPGFPVTTPVLGGAGGGIVRLVLKGVLELEAGTAIIADGDSPQVSSVPACDKGNYVAGCDATRNPPVALIGGGGGAGGSVWVAAVKISGSGTISASGGNTVGLAAGERNNMISPGGAGGGGRVAVYYEALEQTVALRASGGRSLPGTAFGTAGTIWLKNTRTFDEELKFDNNYRSQVLVWPASNLPVSTAGFGAITVTGGAKVRVSGTVKVGVLTLAENAVVQSFKAPEVVIVRAEEVKIAKNAKLAVGNLRLAALNVELDEEASISADGVNAATGATTGVGESNPEGGGGGAGPSVPGGACGAAGGTENAMAAMGDGVALGGKGGNADTVRGGNGGGIVRLYVFNKLTLSAMSKISAQGNAGGYDGSMLGGGGGGGGLIDLFVADIDGEGTITAQGGKAQGGAGGGGGGLIRVYSEKISAFPANIMASAIGGPSEKSGCVGTDGEIRFNTTAIDAYAVRFACRLGQVDLNATMAVCTKCDPGTKASLVGLKVCTDCLEGTFAKDPGTIDCTECFAGTVAPANKTIECTACEPGEQQPTRGRTTCQNCPVGTATDVSGTPLCPECIAGTFQAKTGQTVCDLCPIGESTYGKAKQTECEICLAGFEAPVLGSPDCEECKPGAFSEMDGDSCELCGQGEVSQFAQATSCLQCPPATFAETIGSTECTPCPIGEFVESDGQGRCIPCAVGTFTNQIKSLRCQRCGADRYQDEEGSSSCLPCPSGTYTECETFLTEETCVDQCKWLKNDGGICVTELCTVCTSPDREDCARWDKFAAEFSVLEGDVFACSCAKVGEPTKITMRARTGLNETLTEGGLFELMTRRKRQAPENSTMAMTTGMMTTMMDMMMGTPPPAVAAPAVLTLSTEPNTATTEAVDNGDGTYTFTITPTEAVDHVINIKYGDQHVGASPLTVTVEPADFPVLAIVGIVLGSVCCCALLIGGIVFYVKRKGGITIGGDGSSQYNANGGGGGGDRELERTSSTTALPRELASYEIPIQDLVFEKEIGRGAFGVVYKGQWRDSAVAIKQLLLEETSGAVFERELKTFQDEAATMSSMRPHVNVVLLLGITPAPNLCIVVEFAEGGALYSLLHGDAKITDADKVHYCKGIASGMGHLHAEGIIHRDLAARNILLDGSGNAKVSDFGLSRRCFGEVENQTKSDVGPLKWMAPEAIKDRKYSQRSDIWSYGVTVWEIVAREDPYPDVDAIQVASKVCFNGLRLQHPYNCPPILSEMMDWCFQTEAAQRPTFKMISNRYRDFEQGR